MINLQKLRWKIRDIPENLPLHSYLDEDDLSWRWRRRSKIRARRNDIVKRAKWNPWKRKNTGTGLKILTPNKLLTRLPILLAQIKAGNISNKWKKRNQASIISFVSA